MGSSPPRLIVSERSLTDATSGDGIRPAPSGPIADGSDATSTGGLCVAASSLPDRPADLPRTVEAKAPPCTVGSADYWTQGYASRIRLRVFRPEPRAEDGALPLRQPAVLYLHGGGFVGGCIDDADTTARHLAATLPAVVVTVGYSLAPAAP
ncbi:alpha/beta hydrolase, partial [Ralstonia solanacearum]